MSDEQAIEALIARMDAWQEVGYTQLLEEEREPFATEILAALRAEGYDLYRPEECTYIEVEVEQVVVVAYVVMVTGAAPSGAYRLVPVGGEG